MTEEKRKIDDEVNPHGLADHKALRKMGTERLKELLDQTYPDMMNTYWKIHETTFSSFRFSHM